MLNPVDTTLSFLMTRHRHYERPSAQPRAIQHFPHMGFTPSLFDHFNDDEQPQHEPRTCRRLASQKTKPWYSGRHFWATSSVFSGHQL
jgi:hypothetical protein